MKVFIAIDSNLGLDSPVGEYFGRAAYFLIYDLELDRIDTLLENTFKNDAQGVGIRVATLAVQQGCGAVIGAQPGPKAVDVLVKAGIQILVMAKGTAKQALEHYYPQRVSTGAQNP